LPFRLFDCAALGCGYACLLFRRTLLRRLLSLSRRCFSRLLLRLAPGAFRCCCLAGAFCFLSSFSGCLL
jgi:hypothetical protein